MPSPPWARPPASRTARRRGRTGPALLALLLAAGCASGARRGDEIETEVGLALPRSESSFLLDPTAGYPLVLDGARQGRIQDAFRALVEAGEIEPAAAVAGELLEVDPGFHPAVVLAAQADFARGRLAAAADRLRPVAEELPTYAAAQLLLGRTAETLGRLPEAYRAYLAASRDSPLAAARGRELLPRTLEILANRVGDALLRGRLEEARQSLLRMAAWAPEATLTLEAERRLATAEGDLAAELAAVSELARRQPQSRELAERRAFLELEVGDVRQGLEIYRDLAAAHPGDPELAERLEVAKFRYRMGLLPDEVRALTAEPELTRAQFAVLLYWLVPEVRRGRPAAARIAVDILDHPRREEIARVANLGLMEVDSTLHRFSPDEPLTRRSALTACLAVLAAVETPPACLGPGGVPAATEAVCQTAARCLLLSDAAECLPQATVAGREAVELIRRTLAHS